MGQPQAQGLWDLGVLRTPKGRLLGAQLPHMARLWGAGAGGPAAGPAGPRRPHAGPGPAAGAGGGGARGRLLRTAPALPHGACLTFGLILALLFAYDAFATFRDDVRPLAACDPPEATTT
ncbi:uncharacterized protein [Anser cygnoides]|uniref:uncharacterized protein isoform X3 n=1 Tax=Anser cygnoides TaxID=8845 RepID=UPI0034D33F0F